MKEFFFTPQKAFSCVHDATNDRCYVLHNKRPTTPAQLAMALELPVEKIIDQFMLDETVACDKVMSLPCTPRNGDVASKDKGLYEILLVCLVGYAGAAKKARVA